MIIRIFQFWSFLIRSRVVLLVAIVAMGAWSAGRVAINAEFHNVSFDRLQVNPINGRASLHDIVLPLGEAATLRIGKVSLFSGFALASSAEAAENVTLQQVTVDVDGVFYSADRIELVGSSLGQKELSDILNKNSATPFVSRLAKLSASAVNIPAITIERTTSGLKQTIVLRDVSLRDIAAGKAAEIAASAGTIKGPPPIDGSFSAVSGKNLDLALLSRFLHEDSIGNDREQKALLATLSINNVQFKGANEAKIQLDRLAITNVRAQPGSRSAQFVPLTGTVRATGATFDFPISKIRTEPLKWTLKELALTADEARDGIPTKFNFAVTDLTLLLPPDLSDPSFKSIRDLGYDALVFAIQADASWNAQTSDLLVNQIAIRGAGIGSATLKATLGNVTKEVFSAEKGSAAFRNATAKTMSLTIENQGLYERAVARDARKLGKTPEEMRRILSVSATATVTSMLGPAPDSKSVGAAFAKFAAKPGKLNVSAKAKNASGVPVSRFGDTGTARSGLVDQFDVSATSE